MSAQSGYFIDAVKAQAERAGIQVMGGGYRIYTTLDPALQRQAVDAIVDGTNRIESQKGYKHLTQAAAKGNETDYLQAMAVAIDPFTGDVTRARRRSQLRARSVQSRDHRDSSARFVDQANSSTRRRSRTAFRPTRSFRTPRSRSELPSYRPEEMEARRERTKQADGTHDDARGPHALAQHGRDPARYACRYGFGRGTRAAAWESPRQWIRCRPARSARRRFIRSSWSPHTPRSRTMVRWCSRVSSRASTR